MSRPYPLSPDQLSLYSYKHGYVQNSSSLLLSIEEAGTIRLFSFLPIYKDCLTAFK